MSAQPWYPPFLEPTLSAASADGPRTIRTWEPAAIGLAVAVVLALVYVAWAPNAPDLAAQSARAAAARLTGVGTWWSGWFGGLPLASYSVIVPPVIAVLGVPVTGGLAVVATTLGGVPLLRGAERPRLGA